MLAQQFLGPLAQLFVTHFPERGPGHAETTMQRARTHGEPPAPFRFVGRTNEQPHQQRFTHPVHQIGLRPHASEQRRRIGSELLGQLRCTLG